MSRYFSSCYAYDDNASDGAGIQTGETPTLKQVEVVEVDTPSPVPELEYDSAQDTFHETADDMIQTDNAEHPLQIGTTEGLLGDGFNNDEIMIVRGNPDRVKNLSGVEVLGRQISQQHVTQAPLSIKHERQGNPMDLDKDDLLRTGIDPDYHIVTGVEFDARNLATGVTSETLEEISNRADDGGQDPHSEILNNTDIDDESDNKSSEIKLPAPATLPVPQDSIR